MIIIVPALNYDDTPDAMVDDDAVAVVTIASAMSRNTALPSSTWMAMQRTSSADADPSSSPWPSLHILPPWGGPPHRGCLPPLSSLSFCRKNFDF